MYNQNEYEDVMKKPSSGWAKYGNAPNFSKVIAHLMKGQYIPSIVSLNRAIRELGLRRIDGKTATDDQRELRAAAQANFDAVVAEAQRIPLSQDEVRGFSSLSRRDLGDLWFSESGDYFRIRYSMAMKQYGFRQPQRFGPAPVEDNDGEALELTAAQYRAIPAQVTTRRYMQEPAFKRAVDRLIKSGLIALVLFVTTYVGVA